MKKLLIVLFILFTLSPTQIFAEEESETDDTVVSEEENGTDLWIDDTVTFADVEAELERIASETNNAAEQYEMCKNSTVLSDDMKMRYCIAPSEPGSLLDVVLDLPGEGSVAEQEKEMKFYKAMNSSTRTAKATKFDIFDLGNSIANSVYSLVIDLIETIGGFATLVTLLLINTCSSRVIFSVFKDIFDSLHNFVFGNFETTIILCVLLFVVALIREIMDNGNRIKNFTVFLRTVKKVAIGFLIALFFSMFCRDILYKFDTVLDQSVAKLSEVWFSSSEEFEGKVSSTVLKERVFYAMQEQPFMLRHFGVMSVEAIAQKYEITIEEANARYETLLFSPSTENANNEVKNNGNQTIPTNPLKMQEVLLNSIAMLIHKAVLCVTFSLIAIVLLLANVIKAVFIGVTFVAVFQFVFSRKYSNARMIGNRMSWMLIFSFIPMLILLLFELLLMTIEAFGNIHFILIFVVDLLLFVCIKFIKENKDKIMKQMSMMSTPLGRMLKGDYSLKNGYDDIKPKVSDFMNKTRDKVDSALEKAESNLDIGNVLMKAQISATLDTANSTPEIQEENLKLESLKEEDVAEEVSEIEDILNDIDNENKSVIVKDKGNQVSELENVTQAVSSEVEENIEELEEELFKEGEKPYSISSIKVDSDIEKAPVVDNANTIESIESLVQRNVDKVMSVEEPEENDSVIEINKEEKNKESESEDLLMFNELQEEYLGDEEDD
ncbi:MAG: hypothetical protein ACK5LZ_06110 [Anaerorhabdus sp.]